jgi:hypothetical protein
MAHAPVSWASKLQKTIATSTGHAEYISLYAAATQSVWIRSVFDAIGIPYTHPFEIECDSNTAISFSKQEGQHEAKKHIDVKIHYIQELVRKEEISIGYVQSKENPADIFTKCLTGQDFTKGLTLISFEEEIEETPLSFTPSPPPEPSSANLSLADTSMYVDAYE